MAKKHHRLLSAALAVLVAAGTTAAAVPVSAETADTNASSASVESAASGSAALTGKYATNPGGQVGKSKTISSASDFTEDMIIAQGVANDDPRIFRGSHEAPVYDSYALYAAWDDTNLYLGWQFTNVTDVVDPGQGYPISDNGKAWNGDIPQMLAFDLGKGQSADMTGGNMAGGAYVWGLKVGFETRVDALMCFSSKPGVGEPALFKTDSTGYFTYSDTTGFTEGGISFKYEDGFFGSSIVGIKKNGYEGYVPDDLFSGSAQWVDFLTLGHDKKQDTFYYMTVPLNTLGVTKDYLENTGIGVMHISTFGEGGITSCPLDKTFLDAATEPYSQDESSSAEKEDVDIVTVPLARVGKLGGGYIPDPVSDDPVSDDPVSDDPISDDPVSDDPISDDDTWGESVTPVSVMDTAKAGSTVEVVMNLKGLSNVAGVSSVLEYNSDGLKLDSVTALHGDVEYKESGDSIAWNVLFGAKGESFTSGKDIVKFKFTLLKDISDSIVAMNTVNDIYDGDLKSISDFVATTNLLASASVSGDDPVTDSDTDSSDYTQVGTNIPVSVKSGETFKVAVSMKNSKLVSGIVSTLGYDAKKVKYVNVTSEYAGTLVCNSNASQKIEWNILISAAGETVTSPKDLAVFEFTALGDITLSDKVLDYTVDEYYDKDLVELDHNNINARVVTGGQDTDTDNVSDSDPESESDSEPESDPITDSDSPALEGTKISVAAKAGETVKVYIKAKNAPDALGFAATLNMDTTALKYVKEDAVLGSYYINQVGSALLMNTMLDARGEDLSAETNIFVLEFQALKDISASDDVLAYLVDSFYDTNFDDFDLSTVKVVSAVEFESTDSESDTESDTVTDTESDTVTDTESDTVTDTESDIESDTVTDTESDTVTDTESDTESDSDTNTDSDDDTDSDSDIYAEYLLGDVNGDGKLTALDSFILQRSIAGLITLTADQKICGDVNRDGKFTTFDCIEIQKKVAGLAVISEVGKVVSIKVS